MVLKFKAYSLNILILICTPATVCLVVEGRHWTKLFSVVLLSHWKIPVHRAAGDRRVPHSESFRLPNGQESHERRLAYQRISHAKDEFPTPSCSCHRCMAYRGRQREHAFLLLFIFNPMFRIYFYGHSGHQDISVVVKHLKRRFRKSYFAAGCGTHIHENSF